MISQTLQAETRANKGKNDSRRSRVEGLIPAVVYSHGNSDPILVKSKDFYSIFKGHISESVLLTLQVAGQEEVQVFVKDYQKNPVTDKIEHLDFYKVTAGEKIHTTVPLEFTGSPVGVKKGGIFEQLEREVDVEVFPKDLPEIISIDISNLDIGESIQIKDIVVPESLSFKFEDEHVVAHVITHRAVEEEDEEASEAAEVESEA